MLRAICAAALSPTKLMQPFSPIAGRRAVISACEDPEELWDEELEAMEHLRVLGARASQIAEVKKILRPEVQRLRDNPATEEATFWDEEVEASEHLRELQLWNSQVEHIDRLLRDGSLPQTGNRTVLRASPSDPAATE